MKAKNKNIREQNEYHNLFDSFVYLDVVTAATSSICTRSTVSELVCLDCAVCSVQCALCTVHQMLENNKWNEMSNTDNQTVHIHIENISKRRKLQNAICNWYFRLR